jgi:hypothetical protein
VPWPCDLGGGGGSLNSLHREIILREKWIFFAFPFYSGPSALCVFLLLVLFYLCLAILQFFFFLFSFIFIFTSIFLSFPLIFSYFLSSFVTTIPCELWSPLLWRLAEYKLRQAVGPLRLGIRPEKGLYHQFSSFFLALHSATFPCEPWPLIL